MQDEVKQSEWRDTTVVLTPREFVFEVQGDDSHIPDPPPPRGGGGGGGQQRPRPPPSNLAESLRLNLGDPTMPELITKPQTTRVQLDLSPHELETMNWLMEVCGIKQRKDLFNNAITLLEWAAGEMADGKKIASFDDNTKERNILSMPALNAAARQRYARKESNHA